MRAWYETLSTYLLDNEFQRGKIDKTLFIRRDKDDILLVQMYVDDIIFGSTKKSLCTKFEKMMHKKFQMSSMGELTFFLGLQVKQKEDGIFISQDKYVTEILKKFSFTDVKTASTPMETQKPLLKDEDGEEVDVHMYRSMIGSLMYLTSSRPDIMFAVCVYARYQVNPKVSHLHAVKRIFSDYAGASLEWKSTIRGFEQIVDFLNANLIKYALTINSTIYTSCIEEFWATVKAKTINGEVQLQALMDGKKVIITESTVRRDLHLEDAEGVDCLPNATIFEQLTLMGYEKLSQKLTFYKAFFSPQWKFLIHTILQCLSAKTTAWNEFSSTTAFVIIRLATNQKFNFSKYIFESMVKNLENVSSKFLMYPSEGSANPTDPHHTSIIIQPSTSQPQRKQRPRKPKRKDTEVPQPSGSPNIVADKAVYKERDDSLVRAATTASSLEAEQDSGNIIKTRSKATPNEQSSLGTSSGGVNTPRIDEDSLKLKELMELCTNLQQRVLDLDNTKTAQAQEITSLKLRVKKLEKKGGSRTHKLKRLFKVGRSARIVSSDEASLGDQEDASKQGRNIDNIDKDAEITLVDETQGRYGDDITFYVSDLAGEEVFVAEQGVPNTKPKVKGIVFKEQVESTTTTTRRISSQQPSRVIVEEKGKGKMVEPEPVKKFSKKDQLKLDEEVAQRLQAEFDEQERIEREKAKANIALKETWEDIQAKIEADCLLAERLQAREQEELTTEERDKLFQQLLEKRIKHVAAKREEEKGNRPPTRAQQRSIMYEVDEDKETTELQSLMQVIPDEEEVAIDAIPLATKPPTIVDWKIHKEGKNIYYQIIRDDRNLKMYRVVSRVFSKSDGHYYFRALYRKT
ncbi:uncharacterized mitochondrial protein-like protein [Tanacetum coccineum]